MSEALIQPYLFFDGNCQEALAFYRDALGAEVEMLLLYKESPEPPPPGMLPPGFDNKVMHCSFRIGRSLIMAADRSRQGPGFNGFSLSLALPTPADVEQAFAALAAGGQVQMALTKTFFSPCFGMLTDRFGIGWIVSVAQAA
jgi:PhnB protein